jgi:hypothetical protein
LLAKSDTSFSDFVPQVGQFADAPDSLYGRMSWNSFLQLGHQYS